MNSSAPISFSAPVTRHKALMEATSSPSPKAFSLKTDEAAQPIFRKHSNTMEDDRNSEIMSTSSRSRASSTASDKKKVSFAEKERMLSQTVRPAKDSFTVEKKIKKKFKDVEKYSRTIATTPEKEPPKNRGFKGLFNKKIKESEKVEIERRPSSLILDRRKGLNANILNLTKYSAYPTVSAALFMELSKLQDGRMAARIRVFEEIKSLQKKIVQNGGQQDAEELKALADDDLASKNELDKLFKDRVDDWEKNAKHCIETSLLPIKEFTKKSGRVNFEETCLAMARQLIDQQLCKKFDGGSSEIFLIGPQDDPLFVFKPTYKPNDFDLKLMEEDRICDESRYAFPVSEDSLREYALGVLFPKAPCRILASLKINGLYKQGILVEWKKHLFHVDALIEQMQAAYDNELKPKESLSAEQKELVELGLSAFKDNPLKAGESVSKRHLGPVFEKVSVESQNLMLLELFQYPNSDPNGRNLLLRKGLQGYEGISIDAGQMFPDTWVPFNSPPWLGLSCFNVQISRSLQEDIKTLDATRMLNSLQDRGVVFQDSKKEIFHRQTQQNIEVGGDLSNILNAFHTVVKIGFLNGNYINEIVSVLYGPGNYLHEIFLKIQKNSKEENDKLINDDEYQDLIELPEYENFFAEHCYRQNTKQFWKSFEAAIIRKLNNHKNEKRKESV